MKVERRLNVFLRRPDRFPQSCNWSNPVSFREVQLTRAAMKPVRSWYYFLCETLKVFPADFRPAEGVRLSCQTWRGRTKETFRVYDSTILISSSVNPYYYPLQGTTHAKRPIHQWTYPPTRPRVWDDLPPASFVSWTFPLFGSRIFQLYSKKAFPIAHW